MITCRDGFISSGLIDLIMMLLSNRENGQGVGGKTNSDHWLDPPVL